ncbi:MAG TPA: FHA domain-containing protein [Candidatus Binataceae bacterium]|nr:FHA domain-containing protein [Candidatus Binataceae bacterium]
MIKCTECGYENMDGLDYCDGCGAKLNAAAGAPTAGGGATPAPPAAESAPAQSAQEQASAPPSAEMPGAEPPAAEPPKSEAPTGELNKPAAAPAEPAPSAPSAGAAAAFKAKFTVIRGGRKGQEFPLEDGNNLIGRWDPETGSFPEVDLDADDPEAKISRKHALCRIENGKITVEDIGSLNGTYVNRGQRLQPGSPSDIKNGDEVIIGKTFLKLVVEPIA